MQKKKNEAGAKTTMTDEKLQNLADIDFKWSWVKERNDTSWNQRFEELKNFKNKNRHCRVPRKTPKLGQWVKKQKGSRGRASNSKERNAMLEAIGLFDS